MFSDTRSVLFWEANKEQEMIRRAEESKDQELSVRIAEKKKKKKQTTCSLCDLLRREHCFIQLRSKLERPCFIRWTFANAFEVQSDGTGGVFFFQVNELTTGGGAMTLAFSSPPLRLQLLPLDNALLLVRFRSEWEMEACPVDYFTAMQSCAGILSHRSQYRSKRVQVSEMNEPTTFHANSAINVIRTARNKAKPHARCFHSMTHGAGTSSDGLAMWAIVGSVRRLEGCSSPMCVCVCVYV